MFAAHQRQSNTHWLLAVHFTDVPYFELVSVLADSAALSGGDMPDSHCSLHLVDILAAGAATVWLL